MSAHSYGRSSLASPTHPAPRGAVAGPPEGRSGSHVYDSSSSTTSHSEAENRARGDPRGGGSSGVGSGLQAGSSFASSHYNDVYGDASSAGSRTPSQAVENYFTEQPSGRNLLHVLPAGVSRESHDSVGGSGAAGVTQASPSLGTYTEPPSGRGLVHDQSSSDIDDVGHEDDGGGSRGGGTAMSSPSQSEGSSAWNDTDAQSIPPSYGGGARGGGAYAPEGGAAGGVGMGSARGRSSPVVREVEVYEDDLAVSEGSVAESGMTYGDSEMTYGHDTAAGGSVMSYATGPDGGREAAVQLASGAPTSRAPGRPQQGLGSRYGSSGSSIASRVVAPQSELGSSRQMIPGQESWRNSPLPGGNVGAVERMLSGETTDSSVTEQQARDLQSSQGQEDGDFGTVWLANRAHARQFDAGQEEERR